MASYKLELAVADRTEKKLRPILLSINGLIGNTFTSDRLKQVAHFCAESMTTDRYIVPVRCVKPLLSRYLGQIFTVDDALFVAGFLSHNITELRRGVVVTPAEKDSEPGTWQCIKICDVNRVFNMNNEPTNTIRYDCEIVWGPWYKQKLIKDFQLMSRSLSFFYYKLGLNNRKNYYALPRDPVNMYLLGEAIENFKGSGLTFSKYDINNYLKNRNIKLYKERSKPCPYNLALPCATCDAGYDECFRATRPISPEEIVNRIKKNEEEKVNA